MAWHVVVCRVMARLFHAIHLFTSPGCLSLLLMWRAIRCRLLWRTPAICFHAARNIYCIGHCRPEALSASGVRPASRDAGTPTLNTRSCTLQPGDHPWRIASPAQITHVWLGTQSQQLPCLPCLLPLVAIDIAILLFLLRLTCLFAACDVAFVNSYHQWRRFVTLTALCFAPVAG